MLSGSGRVVFDVASRRMALWLFPDGDLYKAVSVRAHVAAGVSWARSSLALLDSWGLLDWPAWCASQPAGAKTQEQTNVQTLVEATCRGKLQDSLRHHARPFPLESLGPLPRTDLSRAMAEAVPWADLLGQRAAARLRCRVITLAHLRGRQSWAKEQQCVLWQRPVRSPTLHALGGRGSTQQLRSAFWLAQWAGTPLPPGWSAPVLC